MKTAEEWILSFGEVEDEGEETSTYVNVKDIRMIQLDAYKQGMMDASTCAHNYPSYIAADISNYLLQMAQEKNSI